MISKPTGLYPDNETISLNDLVDTKNNIFTTANETNYAIILDDGSISIRDYGRDWYATSVSDFIPINAKTKYIIDRHIAGFGVNAAAMYDSQKGFLGFVDENVNTGTTTFEPIKNASFLRVKYITDSWIGSGDTLEIYEARSYNSSIVVSCQMLSGNNIETFVDEVGIPRAYTKLFLWIHDKYYGFSFDPETNTKYAPRVIVYEDGLQIKLELPIEEGQIFGTLFGEQKPIDLFSLIRFGRSYSWKLRFYEKKSIVGDTYRPTTKIAYGTVSDVHSVIKSMDEATVHPKWSFKMFPHLNIYDSVLDDRTTDAEKNHIPSQVSATVRSVTKNIDKNIKYWISCAGDMMPIAKYRFYDMKYEYLKSTEIRYLQLNFDNDFDGYGNPLSGYSFVMKDLIPQNGGDYIGEPYSIFTNYIDSNWGYFDIANIPDISITDNLGMPLTDKHSYDLKFSSLDLDIDYYQEQGIGVNFYSYRVYMYDDKNSEYVLDYYSGNKYNQDFHVSYDRFFDNKKYKMAITFVDMNQRVFERTIYFTTTFPRNSNNLIASVNYYRPHNSLIVDWSDIKSISPTLSVKDDKIEYGVMKESSDKNGFSLDAECIGDDKKSLYIPAGSAVIYRSDDFGNDLPFENSSLVVDFYGTNLTGRDNLCGNLSSSSTELFKYSSADGAFGVSVRYRENSCIYVYTTNYSYSFFLYDRNENLLSNLKTQLDSKTKKNFLMPFLWNDGLNWNNSYEWKEYNKINDKWRLIISPDGCKLINLSLNTTIKGVKYTGTYQAIGNGDLCLFGDLIYDNIMIINNTNLKEAEEEYSDPGTSFVWTNDTAFLCDFNGHSNGANAAMTLKRLQGYRVYKTIGDMNKLYEVANITNRDSCILEDFAVGDNCKYVYYIYPIITETYKDINGNDVNIQTISLPIISKPISFDEGVVKVFGLREIGGKVYEAVPDEVWRLQLNLDDNGYTLNTDKTFYDTLSKYNQETVGNRAYITKSVGGLLGYIDCDKDEKYVDTYDMLVSWNNFTSSANLKCLVDLRGLILPGNFETNPTVEYMHSPGTPASAKFNWRQKSDLDIIKIYGKLLPFNPTKGVLLTSSDPNYLNTQETKLLYTKN